MMQLLYFEILDLNNICSTCGLIGINNRANMITIAYSEMLSQIDDRMNG